VNPQRWGRSVKQCIKRLNPQMNSHYILRDLDILNHRDLIDYNEINPKNYKISLTTEGINVIEGLFNPERIDSYIESNKDKV
jgi:hypothetical protein